MQGADHRTTSFTKLGPCTERPLFLTGLSTYSMQYNQPIPKAYTFLQSPRKLVPLSTLIIKEGGQWVAAGYIALASFIW
jgi:hypothetical protein